MRVCMQCGLRLSVARASGGTFCVDVQHHSGHTQVSGTIEEVDRSILGLESAGMFVSKHMSFPYSETRPLWHPDVDSLCPRGLACELHQRRKDALDAAIVGTGDDGPDPMAGAWTVEDFTVSLHNAGRSGGAFLAVGGNVSVRRVVERHGRYAFQLQCTQSWAGVTHTLPLSASAAAHAAVRFAKEILDAEETRLQLQGPNPAGTVLNKHPPERRGGHGSIYAETCKYAPSCAVSRGVAAAADSLGCSGDTSARATGHALSIASSGNAPYLHQRRVEVDGLGSEQGEGLLRRLLRRDAGVGSGVELASGILIFGSQLLQSGRCSFACIDLRCPDQHVIACSEPVADAAATVAAFVQSILARHELYGTWAAPGHLPAQLPLCWRMSPPECVTQHIESSSAPFAICSAPDRSSVVARVSDLQSWWSHSDSEWLYTYHCEVVATRAVTIASCGDSASECARGIIDAIAGR